MADIRFKRANSAEARLVSKATERVGQSINLDRVTELCTSAMAFDIADRLRINAELLVDLGPKGSLRRGARCCDPVGLTILVYAETTDDPMNLISVAHPLVHPLL